MTATVIALAVALALPAIVTAGLALFTARVARRVEALVPAEGRVIAVPGGSLHVDERGAGGQAVLLIHGLGGQLRHFTYGVADALADEFRVVSVDRPGSGWSPRAADAPADLSTQAAALAGLIDRIGLVRPLVVGHSLGGAVALALAIEHPHRVGALALIAPLTHPADSVPLAFRALTIRSLFWRRLVAWTLATPAGILQRDIILGAVFGPEPVPADFGIRGGGLAGARPSQFLTASADLQALPATLPALVARYGELTLPVSVLFARGDQVLDWHRNGEALLTRIPSATLELVEGGHMLPITQPAPVAAFIRKAAARLPAPGSQPGTRPAA